MRQLTRLPCNMALYMSRLNMEERMQQLETHHVAAAQEQDLPQVHPADHAALLTIRAILPVTRGRCNSCLLQCYCSVSKYLPLYFNGKGCPSHVRGGLCKGCKSFAYVAVASFNLVPESPHSNCHT